MLVLPYHLPAFHVPQHSFPEDLSQFRGETGRLAVPSIIFFTHFKNGYDVSFSSSYQALHLIATTSEISESGLEPHQPIPLGPSDASHRDP